MPRQKTTTTAPKKRAPRKSAKAAVKAATKVAAKTEPVFNRFVGPEQRMALIAENAYYRAERRGFAPGHEAADWLAAEAEVDAQLMQGNNTPRV